MKKIRYAILFCVISFCVVAQNEPALYAKADKEAMNHWVDSVYQTMSTDERIGQLFIVVAEPKADEKNMQKLREYINKVKVGGVLFSSGKPDIQADVTNRIQKASRIPLFIALDGEWGLSMRLSGTTRFPKNMMLGAVENTALIEAYGKEVGRQCREMGIHINFAPVLDVNSNVDNPVIGSRSFGEDPDVVAEKGIAYAQGLESMNVLSVAKHFPGHGDTSEDSHYTLPTVYHPMEVLDSIELLPFRKYISGQFSGIMTGHLYVPALDKTPDRPTSVSKVVVTDFLKEKLGFQGLCFTDALAMRGAAADKSGSLAVQALLAGNDVALSPGSPAKEMDAVKAAIKDGLLKQEDIDARCRKILQYKYVAGLNNYRPIELKGLSGRLNTPHADWLADKLNGEAMTLLKNDRNYLPVKQLDKKKIAALTIGDSYGDEFPEMLGRYARITHFRITSKSKEADIQKIAEELKAFDVVICGVFTVRMEELPMLKQLAEEKEWVYVFFTMPYFSKNYAESIQSSKAVVMAYESTAYAREYAAQLVFGGIPAKGKLSVTIPDMYYAGTGIFTKKTRLGYQHPEEVGMDASCLDEIDQVVMEGLDKGAYPGCQVLVAKDGMIVYHKSFGFYDYQRKKKVTETSVYDLASASKASGTLLAVMKAYDNRLVTLDVPISLYLPALEGSDKSDLRMEELLYHQSGMPSTIGFYMDAIDKKSYPGNLFSRKKDTNHPVQYEASTYVRSDFKFLPDLVSHTRKAGFTTEAARNFYLHDSFKDSIVKDIRDAKLGMRGKYVYSDINFILLKMIVEKQTNQKMDELLRASFFDRLGTQYMAYNPLRTIDSLLIVPTENDRFLRRQLLRGYVHDEAAAFQGGVSGNAGLFSNANDLAKLLQIYLNAGVYGGETYLSASTCRLFTQSKSPNCRRGLGFDKPETDTLKVSPCGELAPPSVYGHTGYTGTCFWVDPDNKLIYIFLSNRVHPTRINGKLSSLNIRTRVQDIIYRSLNNTSATEPTKNPRTPVAPEVNR
ncbi:MAG: serine hydrolase [Tannerella sp.]|jgi:beta-glucosidase-like glycosyl hydrolase/CubicO group peptidase (beta-lactamase class C family)|nr:serine hydrolase [Tannerella sp.]